VIVSLDIAAINSGSMRYACSRSDARAAAMSQRDPGYGAAGGTHGRAATGRDLAILRDSLRRLPGFAAVLSDSGRPALAAQVAGFDPVADLCDLLSRALEDAPPATLRESGIIRGGYHADLDELRRAREHGKEWIAGFSGRGPHRAGIRSCASASTRSSATTSR
jgi:DNA mismatch repair ATPase MutS